MKKLFIGIDVGKQGAIAAMGGALPGPEVHDIPKFKTEFDWVATAELIKDILKRAGVAPHDAVAGVEDQPAAVMKRRKNPRYLPGGGGARLSGADDPEYFNSGSAKTQKVQQGGQGRLEGICFGLGISVDRAAPRVWQRGVGINISCSTEATAKGRSLAKARELFPQLVFKGVRGKDMDGRSDAILIADYMRRIHG